MSNITFAQIFLPPRLLEKIMMVKSGANKAAMDEINVKSKTPIIVRQVKYLNNIAEHDHRAEKRVIKTMLNFE